MNVKDKQETMKLMAEEDLKSLEKPKDEPIQYPKAPAKEKPSPRKENSMDSLKFLRVIDPDHIPTYLVEQIKERDYEVEKFYQWQRANAVIKRDGIMIPNPYNHLWVLINEKRQVKGFVWFTMDTLTRNLNLHNYSVDKNYWQGGEAIRKLQDHLLQVMKENNVKKAVWATKNVKAVQKYGFEPTKTVVMEYEIKEDKNG